jgi:hypothetical protein
MNGKARGTNCVFESEPIHASSLPYLEISVAGDLGRSGTSLELIDTTTGARRAIVPGSEPGNHWTEICVPAFAGGFKLVARDENPEGWFAFSQPREVGRISRLAEIMTQCWRWFVIAGIACAVASFIAHFAALRRTGQSDVSPTPS